MEHDDVFDADAELAGQVHDGLDGDRRARRQRLVHLMRKARPFMRLQTDAVSQAVGEGFPITSRFDDRARRRVEFFRGDPGPRLRYRLLRNLVNLWYIEG